MKFQLPDECYSVSDIQVYLDYFIKKHELVSDNPPIIIYLKKQKEITIRIKTWYYLELLTPETIKLLESTKT